jgi:hydrogenase maturation protein HypF
VADRDAARTVIKQARQGVNSPGTTSAGRFLDAMSALLGVCTRRHYEGEPAMRLEAAAAGADPLELDVPFDTREGQRVVDVAALAGTLADLADEESPSVLAATAQAALADGLASIAVEAAADRDVSAVGFTGGVAYNDAIFQRIRDRVQAAGLRFLAHEAVPPGDAGLSYGQVVVAASQVE